MGTVGDDVMRAKIEAEFDAAKAQPDVAQPKM